MIGDERQYLADKSLGFSVFYETLYFMKLCIYVFSQSSVSCFILWFCSLCFPHRKKKKTKQCNVEYPTVEHMCTTQLPC